VIGFGLGWSAGVKFCEQTQQRSGEATKPAASRRSQDDAKDTDVNLNAGVETAKYAKYAKGERVEGTVVLIFWVRRFGEQKLWPALFSRISRGSRWNQFRCPHSPAEHSLAF
jgi:hypothetical protein